ncbi:MAG: CHAT domain-containing protein [Thermoanaerobaculia bacterium]
MAAFLEGTLAPGEIAEVVAHLRDCADCRTVTGEAARFEEEETGQVPAAVRPVHRPLAGPGGPPEDQPASGRRSIGTWPVWAAAAAVAVVASIPLLRPSSPIDVLIEASPREYRRVDGRLSGFPWAPLQGGPRGASAEHELQGAAHEVLGRTIDDEAVDARHAAGVANLLIDQTEASLNALALAAGDSKDAGVWNDLAAARYTVAVREDRTALLSSALVAVNRAIELDPKRVDATFNRALILEELGLRDAARREWRRYLELDASSDWSNEARDHLRALGDASTNLDFRKELARAAGNRDAIASLVRRFPQESRTTGEGPLLGDWADAQLANDAARAEEMLALIRAIGETLSAENGERLLLDAVDRMRDRRALANACLTYIAARKAYARRDLRTAEEGFRRAVIAFRATGSPLAHVAEYYAAQCAFDRNRPMESTDALHALQKQLEPSHRALAAEIDASLARNANAAADWGASARAAGRAAATFADLGETASAAKAAGLEAIALERMGALDPAWQRRVRALASLDSSPAMVATILHTAAVALAAADHAEDAGAIMDVATGYETSPETRAAILTDRARFAERAGDLIAARRWLGEARTELTHLDPALRESRAAQLDLTEAVLRRASDPTGATAALDKSIEFLERQNSGIRLPDAYLQRARARRAAGRPDAAIEDYHAALRRIDEQRERVPEESLSLVFLDVAAQTIDETIDLHLERGEAAQAFTVADRAHAMAGAGYRLAGLPEGTALIAYAMLPESVAIFCWTRQGIVAERTKIERGALAAQVLSFARRLRAREDVQKDAASLYGLLIAPVASRLEGTRELVIVPDRQLNTLPFAALHDGTRYLIEAYSVRLAPSAAGLPNRLADPGSAFNAVVIADPATDRAPRLPGSRREAESIAAVHDASIIQGHDATRDRVTEAIASSAIVHYAGHADSNAETYGALLLASKGNDSGLLSAGEIARLELRARPLVVLSACGTLRGNPTHIAGMPSLARAFLGAGARAVVGTLWEIDDDVAAPLFLRFHERLRAGEVPAGALRAAQLAMLQSSDPRLRHPSSWSAVEVLSNL